MSALQNQYDDALVRETLQFGTRLLGFSGAIFYWVDGRHEKMQVFDTVGVPNGFLEDYRKGMQELDPMSVSQMLNRHESVGILSSRANACSSKNISTYHDYLGAYGFDDTIDLMFWGEEHAFGGVGFLKNLNDPPANIGAERIQGFQRFLEASFSTHSHVRKLRIEQHLSASGLSQRERQVTLLIGEGASNKDIADSMNITLATAKTYVVRIFEKLNIDSRTVLVAYLGNLR